VRSREDGDVLTFSHCESGESFSIRKQVVAFLEKNPLLTAKVLCKLLNLRYETHGRYVANVRSEWKSHYRNEQGSKCSSVRRVFFACVLPAGLNAVLLRAPLPVGWVVSRSRNRFRLFRNSLGRVQWFETGRVVLYVRMPASVGKAKQLFCDGFTKTDLITDIRVLEQVLDGMRIKGGKADYITEQRLPYLVIKDFKDTNGVTVVLGDRSHPNAAHVLFEYQEQVARIDQLISEVFKGCASQNGTVPENVLRRDPLGVS
jgi:hypothetical protein